MNDMKLRLVDHSAYNVEYVEEDTLTIVIALVSCVITTLFDLIMEITARYTIEVDKDELDILNIIVAGACRVKNPPLLEDGTIDEDKLIKDMPHLPAVYALHDKFDEIVRTIPD